MSDFKKRITTFLTDDWSNSKRRIVLGLGAAMFVGGWLMTGYTADQVSVDYTIGTIRHDYGFLYFLCVISMTIGAGFIGLSIPKA